MSLRRLWISISLLIANACASVQSNHETIIPNDCIARTDCYLVAVDNGDGQDNIVVRLNGRKLGEVTSYGRGVYPIKASELVEGNCAYVKVTLRQSKQEFNSTRECIYPGQFYLVVLTNSQKHLFFSVLRGGNQ